MRFSLRQLEVFRAVARGQSVRGAAADLAMSQSAVSGALSELERQFGVQLFDRVGKRLQLSSLGRSLWPQTEELLAQADALEQAFLRGGGQGQLKVGATLTIGNYIAVPLMARFMGEDERARVELQVANTATIVARVRQFQLDVGLIEGEIQDPDLDLTPFLEDELVVFCAPDHAFAGRGPLDDAALKSATWISRERGSGTRQAFERAMTGILPDLTVGVELQHGEGIRAAVKAGLGVGCLSRLAVEAELRRGELVACPVPHRNFTRRFYLALHKRKYRDALTQRFVELCLADA